MPENHYTSVMWTHTDTHFLPYYPNALFNTITRLCRLSSPSPQDVKLCKKKCSNIQYFRTWKVFVCCSLCVVYLVWKVDKVSTSFFLPQVYELMENRRKCRLTSQIGYKTTLSPQVVAIPGLLLKGDLCVICCLLAVERSLLRLHKTGLCVSHQPPVVGQMGGVCGVLCVGLGGANSRGLWNKGFPLSLSLFFLCFFFVGQETQLPHKCCDSKNRTKGCRT